MIDEPKEAPPEEVVIVEKEEPDFDIGGEGGEGS